MTRDLLIIAVAALITFALRLSPFLLFGKKGRPTPTLILKLGELLPAAVMAILVLYCLRGIDLTAWRGFLPEFIAVTAVVLLHLWKRNVLLSIGGGTVIYMILVQQIFN